MTPKKFGKNLLERKVLKFQYQTKREKERKLESRNDKKGLLKSLKEKRTSKNLKKGWSSKSTGLKKP